jgi:ATP-dependent RNA helicase RhlE
MPSSPAPASFDSFGLHAALLRALQTKAYSAPTPIQQSAIPPAFAGQDLLATAQTGSGKTAAYALPALQHLAHQTLLSPRRCLVLVLVPTRELAVQVGEVFKTLGHHLPQAVQVTTLFGGVSINPQMIRLRGGADVVVATPGRLLDLIERNALTLAHVELLILDEADRLLDMGFADELDRVLKLLPLNQSVQKKRVQSLFFSATFPPSVLALASHLLHSPVRIEIQNEPAHQADITQRAVLVDAPLRTQLLRHLIDTGKWRRVLVFVATKHAADMVALKLRKAKINAEPFHGEQSQGKRVQVLADFKASRLSVIVATDVAARGLDIASLPVVVNFDLPRSAVDYTHRIGRTGRAGEKGLAVSFVSMSTQAHWRLIQKRASGAAADSTFVALDVVAGFEPTEAEPEISFSSGGIKGKRPSKKDKLRAEMKQ